MIFGILYIFVFGEYFSKVFAGLKLLAPSAPI